MTLCRSVRMTNFRLTKLKAQCHFCLDFKNMVDVYNFQFPNTYNNHVTFRPKSRYDPKSFPTSKIPLSMLSMYNEMMKFGILCQFSENVLDSSRVKLQCSDWKHKREGSGADSPPLMMFY